MTYYLITNDINTLYRTGRTPCAGAVKVVPALYRPYKDITGKGRYSLYRPYTGKKGMYPAERALKLTLDLVGNRRYNKANSFLFA
jgi:hypothetical protein